MKCIAGAKVMFLRETSVYYKTHSSNANLENRRLQAILYSKITPEKHEKLFIGGKVGLIFIRWIVYGDLLEV
jgi:hypothetical protein